MQDRPSSRQFLRGARQRRIELLAQLGKDDVVAAGVVAGVPLAPATVVVTSGLAGVGKNCAETKFQPSRMATDNNIAAIRLRLSSTLYGLSSSQKCRGKRQLRHRIMAMPAPRMAAQ